MPAGGVADGFWLLPLQSKIKLLGFFGHVRMGHFVCLLSLRAKTNG